MRRSKILKPIEPLKLASSGSIPAPKINRGSHLLFSFQLLDFSNPYYNCNGLCDKGIKNCFERLRAYSALTVNDIFSNRGSSSIRFHPIEKHKVDEWPEYLVAHEEHEDAFYQISFGKSKGRAHGLLIDNVFYIIWLDPHHYLYHNKAFGPKKAYDDLEDCCAHIESQIRSQHERIKALEAQVKEYEELLEVQTNPNTKNSH